MRSDADERAYHMRREVQERRQADACADPATAGVHRRLADLYAARVRALDGADVDADGSVKP